MWGLCETQHHAKTLTRLFTFITAPRSISSGIPRCIHCWTSAANAAIMPGKKKFRPPTTAARISWIRSLQKSQDHRWDIFSLFEIFFITRDPIPRWRLWLKNFFLRQQPKKWKVKTQTLTANQSSFLFEFQIFAKLILQNFVENDSNVLYILHVVYFDRARQSLNILPRYDRQ